MSSLTLFKASQDLRQAVNNFHQIFKGTGMAETMPWSRTRSQAALSRTTDFTVHLSLRSGISDTQMVTAVCSELKRRR